MYRKVSLCSSELRHAIGGKLDEVVVREFKSTQTIAQMFQVMDAASRPFKIVQTAGGASCTLPDCRPPMQVMHRLC